MSDIRFYRFHATSPLTAKHHNVSYGVGTIDQAISHCHRLDTYWAEEDPRMGLSFEFRSLDESETVAANEHTDCVLLCTRDELAAALPALEEL